MAEDRIDPGEQVPEADLLDQQAPLDPQQLTDDVPEIAETPGDADEADRLEQHATVSGDPADDYPRERFGLGWS